MRILALILLPSVAFVAWAVARKLDTEWRPAIVLAILAGFIVTMIALAIGG